MGYLLPLLAIVEGYMTSVCGPALEQTALRTVLSYSKLLT